MQGVAELVEQGADRFQGEQGGLAVGGLGDVEGVEHDRPGPEQVRLADERVHPGAAALGVAGVEVGDEQAERAVVVGDVEDADVGVVGREVVALGEAQPVEPLGGAEDAVVQHPLQLEVGAQGCGVDGEAFAAHAFGVEGAVPRGDRVSCGGRQLVGLFAGVGGGDRGEPLQHRVDGRRRPGRRGLDDPRRVVGMAQQVRPLGAQGDDREQGRPRVVFAAEPACDGRLVQSFPQVAIGECGEGRLLGGEHEGEQVAVEAAGTGGERGGRARVGGEAVEPGGVGDVHGGGRGPGQQPVAERGRQRRELRVDRAEPLLLGRGEPRARAHGVAVVAIDQPLGLRPRARITLF